MTAAFTIEMPMATCEKPNHSKNVAAGNEYGFDEIFARQVAAFGAPGDVLICLTTSGKSKNVKRAGRSESAPTETIALLGCDGGSTVGMADVDF